MGDLLNTMKTRRILALLLLALLLVATVSASRRRGSRQRPQRIRQCNSLPRFRVNGVEPMEVVSDQVTLVALLTSNCPFCIAQSRKLQRMYTDLQTNGSGVHMMIINGGPRPAPGQNGTFERIVSFPVYHDDNRRTIWGQVFHGSKDDIFILDRCGQITYRIPFPYSYLGYNYVQRALRRTLGGSVCPNCQPSNLNDRMMGDAPALDGSGSRSRPGRLNYGRNSQGYARVSQRGNSGVSRGAYNHRNMNRSRCPRYDPVCRLLRRARRRYNRYRLRHRIHLRPEMREEEMLDIFDRSQRRRRMDPVF